MATDIVAVARDWIGTPYQHQASLKGVGCDCLGLLRGVWRELRGEEPEDTPPYAPDWADAGGGETLRDALARHLAPIALETIAPGDVVLFRMTRGGPARHCGIVGEDSQRLTLIHARQSHRVMEELLSQFWTVRLAYAFRLNVGCRP
jgi:NlpC/P60 family putative phage cell wall peptidase